MRTAIRAAVRSAVLSAVQRPAGEEVLTGTVTVNDATLTAGDALTLTFTQTSPEEGVLTVSDPTPDEGGDVTLTFTPDTYTYQWNLDGVAIVGATTNPYTIDPVAESDAGSYTIDVTNDRTGVTKRFGAVAVTVDPAPVGAFPLDLYSNIVRAWSFRRLRTDYTGPQIRARRYADDVEDDFYDDAGVLKNSGNVDIVTWANGSAYLAKIYDQIGTDDWAQTTNTNQPAVVLATVLQTMGTRPAAYFDGFRYMDGTFAVSGTTLTTNAICSGGPSAAYGRILSIAQDYATNDYDATSRAAVLLRNNLNQSVGAYRAGLLSTATIDAAAPFVATSKFDGTNHTIYLDSVAGTPVASTGTFSTAVARLCQHTAGGDFAWVGNVCEMVMSSEAWGDSQRAAIEAEQITYYGI